MAAGFAVILAIDAGLHAAGSARVPCIVLAFTLGAAVGWRRSRPLAYVTATLALTGAVTVVSASLAAGPLFGAFVLVVPTYTVAASLPQRRAAIGLAIWTAGATLHAVLGHISPSRLAGSLVAAAVVFAVGRLSRAQRALAAELEARNAELAAQRDSRAHVAVLAERNRIARDLHLLIAQTITAMVVQAAAAKELVRVDLARAPVAAAAVEQAGREVLTRMRRVLGVLRANRLVPLQPHPAATTIAVPT
jgi:signal transduction histidine kinase